MRRQEEGMRKARHRGGEGKTRRETIGKLYDAPEAKQLRRRRGKEERKREEEGKTRQDWAK